jgi:16S rRNA (uracil1498-N3)-methyltransferase
VAEGPISGDGPHVFVESLDELQLSTADAHHLSASLRLRDGDPLTVTDGDGNWRQCRFGSSLVPIGEVIQVPRLEPQLTICFALIKGARPELIVQKLTELGIDRILPFEAARSVVRSDPARVVKQMERLRRVAREAAMQSRRVRLPEVGTPQTFDQVASLAGAARCSPGGRQLTRDDACLLIGPEGGWADPEIAAVADEVDLGPQVLRAETAALAAATLSTALRSGVIAAP